MRRPTPLSTLGAHAASSDGESVAGSGAAPAYRLGSKSSVPSPSLQIPLLARVQALEDKLPAMEGRLRGYLPGGQDTPSRSVGQGTLVARVGALEKAMDTLLRAQQVAMEKPSENKSRGCCACCSVM